MLPISPISGYTRSRAFVQQEWDAYFGADGAAAAHAAPDGWRGILFANLAIIDAGASYGFFADPGFAYAALDGGASRTWYLAFAAALGGL
jgi:endo-1,3(4)-beta-glucanase